MKGPHRGAPSMPEGLSELLVCVDGAVVTFASANVADLLRGTCAGAGGRVAYELYKPFGIDVAHEAYARAEPLEFGGGRGVERIRVLELAASLEFARRRLHVLVEGQHPRLVLGDAGRILLVECLADERVRRHDDAGLGPVFAREPGAIMVHDLAVFVVVDELPEIVDGAVVVLGEEVERPLDQLVVRKNLLFEHQYLDTCDLASLAQHGRFESCSEDCACIRVGIPALERLRPKAGEREQWVIDVGLRSPPG